MKTVVAFVGYKNSGKSTAAQALCPEFTALSFADAIKDALAAIFCWDRQMLEGSTAESRLWREQIDPWWAERLGLADFTPRWAMTNFGTDIMRRQFNENIWLYNIERRIALVDGPVVICDARFPNEIALARSFNGRVYRIQRGPIPWWEHNAYQAIRHDDSHHRSIMNTVAVHESEWAWLGEPVDAIIRNDGTIAELVTEIRRIIRFRA